VIPKEGGEKRKVIDEEHQASASWSPEGKLLVSGHHLSDAPLRVVDLDTEEIDEIAGPKKMSWCAWSPDGRSIACNRGYNRVFLYDVENETWTELESCKGMGPSWSADGRYLYFFNIFNRTLGRMSMSDGKVEEVADLSDVVRRQLIGLGTYSDQWPYSFGPHGELITLRAPGRAEIYAMDLELP
jgi:Tol biopolymer transport system component